MSEPIIQQINVPCDCMRNLTGQEKVWFNLLFAVDFYGKSLLLSQLSQAICNRSFDGYCYDLRFDYPGGCTVSYLFKAGSPVSMQSFQKDAAPVLFTLLVYDWRIDQLLIQSAAGDSINLDNLSLDNVVYTIDERADEGSLGQLAGRGDIQGLIEDGDIGLT